MSCNCTLDSGIIQIEFTPGGFMSFKSSIAGFFRTFFTGLFKRHGQSLLDTALGLAVGFATVLLDQDIPGKEKREIVKKQLVSALAVQGKELLSHELDTLVQLAANKVLDDQIAKKALTSNT